MGEIPRAFNSRDADKPKDSERERQEALSRIQGVLGELREYKVESDIELVQALEEFYSQKQPTEIEEIVDRIRRNSHRYSHESSDMLWAGRLSWLIGTNRGEPITPSQLVTVITDVIDLQRKLEGTGLDLELSVDVPDRRGESVVNSDRPEDQGSEQPETTDETGDLRKELTEDPEVDPISQFESIFDKGTSVRLLDGEKSSYEQFSNLRRRQAFRILNEFKDLVSEEAISQEDYSRIIALASFVVDNARAVEHLIWLEALRRVSDKVGPVLDKDIVLDVLFTKKEIDERIRERPKGPEESE